MQGRLVLPVCLIVLALVSSSRAAEASPPNIVFILADDVGCEVLSCYGGESYQTPHIDALAQGGRRFTHGYSMPVCHPSRTTLLTGRYPATIGRPKWGEFPRAEEDRTFAAVLRRAGYATAIAGKWQLATLSQDFQQPTRMGFDEWSLFGWHEGPRYHDPLIFENGRVRPETAGKFGPDLYVDFLIDFIRRHRAGHFLAYYSMALCHDVTNDLDQPVPYGPDGRYLSYAEMVAEMDERVGRLVAALDELQLREETLILFTTDNGTPKATIARHEAGPSRQDQYVREKVFSQIDGRSVPGGKGDLTDWGTRVPLIANWPGRVPAGTTSDALVDFSDFLPTLAALAGAPLPATPPLDGHNFAPQLTSEAQPTRKYAYAERGRDRSFVRTKRYKLYSTGEFYDMESDPEEEKPIEEARMTAEQTQVREKLEEALGGRT